MNPRHLQSARTTAHRPDLRHWWLVVVLALVSTVLVINAIRVTPIVTEANAAFLKQSEPAAPSLVNDSRVHESISDPAPMDAAARGVMNYIKVHESVPDRVIRRLMKIRQSGPD